MNVAYTPCFHFISEVEVWFEGDIWPSNKIKQHAVASFYNKKRVFVVVLFKKYLINIHELD